MTFPETRRCGNLHKPSKSLITMPTKIAAQIAKMNFSSWSCHFIQARREDRLSPPLLYRANSWDVFIRACPTKMRGPGNCAGYRDSTRPVNTGIIRSIGKTAGLNIIRSNEFASLVEDVDLCAGHAAVP